MDVIFVAEIAPYMMFPKLDLQCGAPRACVMDTATISSTGSTQKIVFPAPAQAKEPGLTPISPPKPPFKLIAKPKPKPLFVKATSEDAIELYRAVSYAKSTVLD